MAVSSLMSIGAQALMTAYRQVQTTSNNISNANTEGYSRQHNVQATMPEQLLAGGWIGRGVTTETIQRASDQFLGDRISALQSANSADASSANLMQQLEAIFTGGQNGLGNAATQIFNAFSDLAATPADLSARQAVVGRLQDFASAVRSAGERVGALQGNIVSDLQGAVTEVNGLAQKIAALNRQIGVASGSGHSPNDLLDQRDLLVKQLSEQIDVQTVHAKDGQVSVFIATGQSLVVGIDANPVLLRPDPYDSKRAGISISIGGKTTLLADDFVQGGKIGGLLRFQGTDLADARNRLGQFVGGVAEALNQQQQLGLDLSGQPGAALFTLAPARALPASKNVLDGSGQPLAQLQIERADPSALRASEYKVTIDPADSGRLLVTRLADGAAASAVSIASGDVYDGLRITMGGTAPQPGDSFLVQGVGDLAAGIEVAQANPRGLAAAAPITAVTAAANRGSVLVSTLSVTQAPTTPYADAQIRFTAPDGADPSGRSLLYEVTDAGGSVLASGSYAPGSPLVWNGMELTLSGVPKVADGAWPGDPNAFAGDVIALKPTQQWASNNGNALSFDSLASKKLIFGETAAETWSALFTQVGVRTQSANSANEASGNALGLAHQQMQSVVGVNVDEEVARMLQFQQGYQASAKVLQTAQTLLDSVIQMVA